jgi:cysteine synthase A
MSLIQEIPDPPRAAYQSALQRLEGISGLIGNTPMLAIDYEFKGIEQTIHAKYEFLNLTGSIKDRMVYHIFKNAYLSGELQGGDTIVEVSSGNTGISCAAIGGMMGHPVLVFMPDWMSSERPQLIRSYGAKVVAVSREQGGFSGCLRLSREYAAEQPSVFLPRQFENAANVEEHWLGTGPEIWEQLERDGLTPDAFVAAVGTGGTIMGVGGFLRSKLPLIRIHPVEPLESPLLSGCGPVGHHRIEGISDGFVPAILDLDQLDASIAVSDGDSILAAQSFASQLGLGVGISSGCNFLAAVRVQQELGPQSVVVTVFPDDNKKYLSTDLMCSEKVMSWYLSQEIKLLRVLILPPASLGDQPKHL